MSDLKIHPLWVITNHYAGIMNQAIGLAERVSAHYDQGFLKIHHKIVRLRPLWRALSPYTLWGARYAFTSDSHTLTPPWPQLIIAAGRQAILPALWVKKQSHGFTRVVYLQDPRVRYADFDLIICPYHDYIYHNLSTKNAPRILPITGATHRVTLDAIESSKNLCPALFEDTRYPRISVIIGGPNKIYDMDEEWAKNLVSQLCALHTKWGAYFFITCSRRTPLSVQKLLTSSLNQFIPGAFFLYTGEGQNPYPGLLGSGDIVILTCDSISMISEVCSTSKPVYLIPLPQKSQNMGKFQIFYNRLTDLGRISWLNDLMRIDDLTSIPSAQPLDDHHHAIHAVLELLNSTLSTSYLPKVSKSVNAYTSFKNTRQL